MSIIFWAFILGILGLLLSGVFSGSETAFYRASRLRFELDAIEHDKRASRVLRLINRPDSFIITVLIGNNVANYAVSLAIVLGVGAILGNQGEQGGTFFELTASLALAPVLFIYGEMFPKYLCLCAPNLMLRQLAPLIEFFKYLFLPVAIPLRVLHALLIKFVGASKENIRLQLGRGEIVQIIEQGHQTGVLLEVQRNLSREVFELSEHNVTEVMQPCSNWQRITSNMSPIGALEIAKKYDTVEMPVYERGNETGTLPIGYVRTIDLEQVVRTPHSSKQADLLFLLQTELPLRSTVEISARHSILTAMILMQTLNGTFGCVIDDKHGCIGFIHANDLRNTIFELIQGSGGDKLRR